MKTHIIFSGLCWLVLFAICPWMLAGQEPDAAVSMPSVSRVQAPVLRFDHLSVEDGLSHTGVCAVTQDRLGFLWFGTAEGLNKYDGYSFTVYKPDPENPNSLSDSYITMIHEDRDGMLWIGTKNGGLHTFDPATETFTCYQHDPQNPESISDNSISYEKGCYEDAQGNIWIGTWNGGFNKFDPRTKTFTRYQHDPENPNSPSHNTVHAITPANPETRSGMIWIGTMDGLNLFDPVSETFTRYYHRPDDPTSLSHNTVMSLYVEPRSAQDPVLWIGTIDGNLNRFDPETQHFTAYPLSENLIENILPAVDGTLWIATLGSGLFRFDPRRKTLQQYRHQEHNLSSLSSDLLRALYRDRSGTLWITTHTSGVDKYDPQNQKFYLYQHHAASPESLSASNVFVLYHDTADQIWIGTQGGGLNRLNPRTGVFTHYQHDPEKSGSLSHNLVGAVYEDRQGTLWIGTFGGGLNRFDRATGEFTVYRHDDHDPNSISENNVMAIFEDQFGILWVGTVYGGLNAFDRERETFRVYRNDPSNPGSLISNTVRSVYEDRAGVLWICTEQGLERFDRDHDRFIHYRHDDRNPRSLSHNQASRVYEDKHGNFWVTTVLGLNRFDPQTGEFQHYFEKDGLPHNRVTSIIEDDQGYLWLGTAGGLSRFDPRSETFRNYDRYDGLQGNLFYYQAAAKDAGGRLYFGGPNGLNVFDPAQLQRTPHIPPVVLTNFQLSNQDVPIGPNSSLQRHISLTDTITLTHDQARFSFEFAALNYTIPAKNQYAYMLTGFDEDWIVTESQRRFARYTNIDPGEYVFRVKASNNDGLWNEQGISVKIIILPPWWATWWFRASVAALVVGLIGGGYRWRVNLIEARNRWLESQISHHVEELQHSEQRYRMLAENMEDVIWILDEQYHFTYISPSIQKLRGLSPEEAMQEMIADTLTPASAERVGAIMQQRSEEEQQGIFRPVDRFEIEQYRRDGSTVWVECITRRVYDARKNLQGIIGVSRDISVQKQTENALRESEERFRMAFEHASVGMCLVSMDGRFLQVNSQMCATFGYSQEEFSRMTVNDLTHPDYLDVSPTFIKRATSGEVTHATFEKLYLHKEGRLLWGQVTSALAYDMQGQPAYFISHVQDITERKRAEEALRKSEERFAAVMNSMEALMYVADMETYTILFINQYTRKIFGDVEGQICWQTFQADQTGPCAFCTNPLLVKDKQPTGAYTWEFQNTKTGGWYHIQDQAIRWVDGRLARMEIATDITTLKATEEALRQSTRAAEEARKAAEAANQAKTAFLANMSHELRTPLNGILGYTQLFRQDPALSQYYKERIDIIEQSGQYLLTLITDILDLAKVESGKTEIYPTNFHLLPFLKGIQEIIGLRAEKKKLAFVVDMPPAHELPVHIHGDERRLRQVLLNLLGNAIKYTDKGRVTFRIRSKRDEGGDMEIPVSSPPVVPGSSSLLFEVEDTGIGIASEDLERIFEPFQQAGGQKYQKQGTGLGLAISRNLVSLMGGELQVRSQPGQGSVFWFELALPQVEEQREQQQETQARISGVKGVVPKILVVDDSPENRRLFVDILSPLGFDMREAEDGLTGLSQAKVWRPDAMIIDLRMPGMDGLELIQRLRQFEELQRSVIIAASASVYPEDAQRSLEAGSDVFLPKPIHTARLLTELHRLLSLEWHYQTLTASKTDSTESREIILPPPDVLRHLLKLSEMGDIAELHTQLEQLAVSDDRYDLFTQKLQRLLRKFQLDELSSLLEEYIDS